MASQASTRRPFARTTSPPTSGGTRGVEGFGLEVDSVGVKDGIQPGEMTAILAKVVEAERAAGERDPPPGRLEPPAGRFLA